MKSRAPSESLIHPPGPQTQWATGTYTRRVHTGTRTSHAANFMRSAIAPLISAAVRIANVSWNVVNSSVGTLPVRSSGPMPTMPAWPSPPISPANASSPNASE